MKTIIAVDPGASGGIAVHFPDGRNTAFKMPATEGDILGDVSAIILAAGSEVVAYVEVVGGYIAGNPAPGSTMFNFGRGYGFLLGIFMAKGIRIQQVRPQVWQKDLGLGTKGDASKTEWKNKLKSKAQQLYPHVQVTLANADALLILDYAIKQEGIRENS